MARCPTCRSKNLRDNYHPAPLIIRLFGFRALICNECNRQFMGFSIGSPTEGVDPYAIPASEPSIEEQLAQIELARLESAQLPPAPPAAMESFGPRISETPSRRERVTVAIRPDPSWDQAAQGNRNSGRNERTAPVLQFHSQSADSRKETPIELKPAEPDEKLPPCPQCGSYNVRRRLRKRLERVTVAMIDNEAFHCDHCSTPFYSSPEDEINNNPSGYLDHSPSSR